MSTSPVSIVKAAPSGASFDWTKMTPSPNLTWAECFSGRECTRLEVPLDYSDPAGDKAAIALIRVKAKVSPGTKEYRGPVLFNPGGPGGSGVSQILDRGELYQQMLGDEFDIVGFDPRGVGETTPAVSVFTDVAERAAWDAGAPPFLNSTPDALSRSFLRAQLFNGLVESRSKRAAEFANTPVVARDMLSIVKSHGRDRLQYWGFSYGSILGLTYAAMFPNNIERLIIDGVQDFDDYYSGSWSENLLDTDKVLQLLSDKCADAGPACPLHDDSGALVRQRIDSILASIKANPLPVINGDDYGIIDFTIVKTGLFGSLSSPFSVFPPLAQAFAALEKGDGQPFLTLWKSQLPLPKCDASPQLRDSGTEASLAVKCGDGLGANNTLPAIMQHFENLSRISIFADGWTDAQRTACSGWKVQPKERFSGPFSVNTSFPVLVIGNTADPNTPLAGAQKAERTLHGAVLLTINTPGHTSEAATSLCARKIVRNYFSQGNLPDKGTICEIEDVLFEEQSAASQNLTVREAEVVTGRAVAYSKFK